MENKIYKIRLKKGDTVIVLAGKYKGQTGKITATHPRESHYAIAHSNTPSRRQMLKETTISNTNPTYNTT